MTIQRRNFYEDTMGKSQREFPESQIEPPPKVFPDGVGNAKLSDIVMKNPRNYICVPQFNGLVIALEETHKGKDMYYTLNALKDENLNMPNVAQFMRHWLNLLEATQGKRDLVYADGTPVEKDKVTDLWNYNSSGHRGGCWTWLNNLFEKDGDAWYMKTNLEVVGSGKKRSLDGKRTKLDSFLEKDAFVSLDVNSQGFPNTEYSNQSYKQGTNFKFWYPRDGAVAGFYADSDGAYLLCGWSPSGRYGGLGVLACAEGTASQKILGDSK